MAEADARAEAARSDPVLLARQAVAFAAAKLSEREAVFSAHTLTREAGDYAFGKLGHGAITAAIAEAQTSGALVPHPIWTGAAPNLPVSPRHRALRPSAPCCASRLLAGAWPPACRADRRRARGRAGRAAIERAGFTWTEGQRRATIDC
jgi:hypothetical protein